MINELSVHAFTPHRTRSPVAVQIMEDGVDELLPKARPACRLGRHGLARAALLDGRLPSTEEPHRVKRFGAPSWSPWRPNLAKTVSRL